MIGACYLDYSRIGRWAKEIMLAASVVLLVGIEHYGTSINGAIGWIYGYQVNVKFCCFSFSFPFVWGCVIPIPRRGETSSRKRHSLDGPGDYDRA